MVSPCWLSNDNGADYQQLYMTIRVTSGDDHKIGTDMTDLLGRSMAPAISG
jgi:hypothetical protein